MYAIVKVSCIIVVVGRSFSHELSQVGHALSVDVDLKQANVRVQERINKQVLYDRSSKRTMINTPLLDSPTSTRLNLGPALKSVSNFAMFLDYV